MAAATVHWLWTSLREIAGQHDGLRQKARLIGHVTVRSAQEVMVECEIGHNHTVLTWREKPFLSSLSFGSVSWPALASFRKNDPRSMHVLGPNSVMPSISWPDVSFLGTVLWSHLASCNSNCGNAGLLVSGELIIFNYTRRLFSGWNHGPVIYIGSWVKLKRFRAQELSVKVEVAVQSSRP